MTECWVPHDTRDEVVDYVNHWIGRTGTGHQAVRGLVGRGDEQVLPVARAVRPRQRAQRPHPARLLAEDREREAIVAFHDRRTRWKAIAG